MKRKKFSRMESFVFLTFQGNPEIKENISAEEKKQGQGKVIFAQEEKRDILSLMIQCAFWGLILQVAAVIFFLIF